ncbi:SRPBCC family protein [Rhodocaloribacter sp.]
MKANEYHFLSRWRVIATVEEVSDILGDAEALPRWWPAVYLDVETRDPGDENGLGKRVRLRTRGWLPYTLSWEFRTVASRKPFGWTLEALGDFEGRGVWTFVPDGPEVEVIYDWRIRAEKPLLRRLSPLLKPLFSANHRWAMRRGEESLRLELARRRAPSAAARARIPAPPGPSRLLFFR